MFETFTPKQLRDATEVELQKAPDPKTAALTAIKRLTADPEYYAREHGLLEKAKNLTKLIKKQIINKMGKRQTVYVKPGDAGKGEDRKSESKPVPQTETPEFKKWFGDSKVVDKDGKPLVVYHGTTADFKEFKRGKIGENYGQRFSDGFYFTENAELSEGYSKKLENSHKQGSSIKPVYLSLKNPLEINSPIEYKSILEKIKEKFGKNIVERDRLRGKSDSEILGMDGYDGVIYKNKGEMEEIVAFSPTQIKSATGNRGTFDPNEADMTKASGAMRQGHKYIKRIPKASGKGFHYFYTKQELKDFEGQKKKESGGFLKSIMFFFNFSSEKKMDEEIHSMYGGNKERLSGISENEFKDYLSEYVSNKEKWDSKLADKKKTIPKRGDAPKIKDAKDKSSLPSSKEKYSLKIMKEVSAIANGYTAPSNEKPVLKDILNIPEDKRDIVLSKNFRDWFGDWVSDPASASKVVDAQKIPEEQVPTVVYHGTARGGFTKFDKAFQQGGLYGKGFYFTADHEIAKSYAENKDSDQDSAWSNAQGFSLNGEKVEFIPKKTGDIIISEISQQSFKNGNWDDAIIQGFKESLVEGKGYEIEKLFNVYNLSQELSGKHESTITHGKAVLGKKIAKAMPGLKPVVPDPEVFEVFLNIRNPLDLDQDMSIGKPVIDRIKKENQERGLASIGKDIERDRVKIKDYKEYAARNPEEDWSLKNQRSNFHVKDESEENGWKTLSLQEVDKLTDEQLHDIAMENRWDVAPDRVTHFKHVIDSIPKEVINPWAIEKGYATKEKNTYIGEDKKEHFMIYDGDIPGDEETFYELINMISKHGISTYDPETKKRGVKFIPNTPDGKPTLQHLAYVLSDGGWNFHGGDVLNEWAKENGYDGLKHTGGWNFSGGDAPKHTVWIAFEPNQIKSSNKNEGTFNPADDEMTKARVTKYIKRVPKPTGKGYYYFYTKQQIKDYNERGIAPEEKPGKFNLLSTIKNLFGFQDEKQAKEKVKEDYKSNAIADRFSISLDSWANHLSEYFTNKDKWTAFFERKKEKSPGEKKGGEPKGEKGEKKEKTKGIIKLSVMKTIHDMYGAVRPVEVQETEVVITDAARRQEILNSIAEGEMILKGGKKISGEWMSKDELAAVQRSVNNSKRKLGIPVTIATVQEGEKLPAHLQGIDYKITDVTPPEYGPGEPESKSTMPETDTKYLYNKWLKNQPGVKEEIRDIQEKANLIKDPKAKKKFIQNEKLKFDTRWSDKFSKRNILESMIEDSIQVDMPEGFFAQDEDHKYYNYNGNVYKINKGDIIEGIEGVSFGDQTPVPYDQFMKDNFETMPENEQEITLDAPIKAKVGSGTKRGQSIQEATGKIVENVVNFIERGLFTATDFLSGQDVTKHIDKDLGKYVTNPIVWNAVVAAVKAKYFPTQDQLAEQVKEVEKTAIKRNVEIVEAIKESTPENRAEKEAEIMDYPKEPWAMTFDQYKKTLFEYRNQYVIDQMNARIASRERIVEAGPKENDHYFNITVARLKQDKETLSDYIEGKIDENFKNNPTWDFLQKQYNSIKDKESPEAKALKRKLNIKENKARAEHERLIKNAIKDKLIIPANVLKEYPEIQNNEAKTMSVPDINYKPVQYEKTIYLGAEETEGNKRTVKINDYSKIAPKDVYLADEETILNVPRPSYIPEMDLENFAGRTGSTQNFDIVRMGPNKYVIVDKRYPVARSSESTRKEFDERSAYTVFEGKEVDEKTRMAYNENAVGKRNYFEMSAETLAATWDYYRKLYSAKERLKHEEREDREERRYNEKKKKAIESGKPWPYAPFKRSGIRPQKANPDARSMTFSQAFMIQDFTGLKAPVSEFSKPTKINMDLFENYQTMLRELEYKINDLRLQRKYDDESNTFKKGEDTSYGDAGLKDNLLQAKGVLVKRQNGTEIDEQEITKIGMLLDDIYSVYGDRSSMSQKYGLKISYAGDKRMHASKAIGVFIDHYKCIAISDTGIEGRGFTFAHEFSHFMDSYLGEKDGYHFASDKDGSIANDIAIKFRRDMNLKTNPNTRKAVMADYYNRTCECFARAMEQYYAIKQGTEKELYDKNKMSGAYIDHNKFLVKIMPLCEQFLKDNDTLLKAINQSGKIFYIKKV